MFGNPQRYKVALQQYETRHSNAGCLLALLFVAPFLARTASVSIATIGCCALVYVCLLVPLFTGYITARSLIAFAKRAANSILFEESSFIRRNAREFKGIFKRVYNIYLQLENVHTTTNQVVFNMVAEKVICPDERFASLYVLLFFTVLAYLQQSLKKRQWSHVLHEATAEDFVRLTTAFVVARMGKAVVMGLVLLTFTVQFNDIEPPLSYVFLTATFFLITQFPGEAGKESLLVSVVRGLDLSELEGLEEWWLPTITRSLAALTSAVFVLLAALQSRWLLAALLCFTNVYVSWQLMLSSCWEPLQTHRRATAGFPLPSPSQLRDRVCPVCLDDMRLLSARVTPCGHILHAYCLRKCIQSFQQCPLCKHPL